MIFGTPLTWFIAGGLTLVLFSYDGVRRCLTGDGLVASTGELWRRQRKLLAPFFTPRGVQDYAEIMLRDSARLNERWEGLAGTGQAVEIGEEMMRVTAAIILKPMFSAETDEDILALKDIAMRSPPAAP